VTVTLQGSQIYIDGRLISRRHRVIRDKVKTKFIRLSKLRLYSTFILWASGTSTEADIGLVLSACMSSLRFGGGNSTCYRRVAQYLLNWKSPFFEKAKRVVLVQVVDYTTNDTNAHQIWLYSIKDHDIQVKEEDRASQSCVQCTQSVRSEKAMIAGRRPRDQQESRWRPIRRYYTWYMMW